MPNLVVHFEIHASDPDRLIAFYSQLLGWSFQRFGEMDYWSIDTGEGAITPSGGERHQRRPDPTSGTGPGGRRRGQRCQHRDRRR